MSTKKEGDGYPNTEFDFYSNGSSLKVSLTPQSPAAKVTITLGSKAATLNGTISDAVTGAPVIGAGACLWRLSNPDFWVDTSVSPTCSLLIPSQIPVVLKLHAPGYADWYYPGVSDASKATALTLDASKSTNIDVQLQPKPQ